VEGGAAAAAAAKVGWEDLLAALTQVGPSALRELELQVPRVSWDDIGGQHELKQARGRGGGGAGVGESGGKHGGRGAMCVLEKKGGGGGRDGGGGLAPPVRAL